MRRPEDLFPRAWGFGEEFKHKHLPSGQRVYCGVPLDRAASERQIIKLLLRKEFCDLKRIMKSVTASFMILVVFALSIITVIAASDPIQNVSYSYSETGNCTVDYGDSIWVNEYYTYTHRYTVNGKIATCSWSTNDAPSKGTYKNATKYYLSKSAMRAKAFYWLYLDNEATISSANAKYDSSSKTYWDDIQSAIDDAGNVGGAYAFVHSVIDYLQQGKVNPYCLDSWNNVVKKFAAKTDYYPNVPTGYEIFYFYPEGKAAQSLMSWESTPHAYIKVIKSSTDTSVTSGNSSYTFNGIEYYVSKSKTDFNTSGSNYLGYIKLNAAGEGHSKDGSRATLRNLYPGTYYIKEGYVPNNTGYEKNNTVYTVTVTKNHTATAPLVLRVSDTPKTCYGKIVKASTRPEITNGNPDYSMEGIRYSFSKSKTDFSPSGSNYIGYVQLDENGVGYTANGSRATLRNLVPGTYYVKESVIPAGCKYKMDNTVYTMAFTFSNTQNHLKVLNVKDEPEGSSSAKIIKKSSDPDITDGNPLYSFKDAEFTIYKTQADAQRGSNAYTTVTTDENCVATVSDIELGTYYIKETKAPFGFEPSEEIKELKAETYQEEAYEVEFEDKPITAPLSVLLQKKNATTGETVESDMSGAEYTVSFYADYFEDDDIGEAIPLRTWVLVTDRDNLCKYDSEHCISGDDLFKDGSGSFVLPLGTITIQETKAPDDFYLDENVYVRRITTDGAADITQYNTPVSNELEIPHISLSGEKTWDDDNNRDGKRPKSVTVELYREDELIDSATMSEETDWKYEFTGLPKGYADLSLDDHIYFYRYEVKEGTVQYYTSDSTGVDADPDDSNHLICDFTNHYKPAKISVSGTKSWEDYNDQMGYRPEQIKVILNRDGEKLDEVTTSEAENWSYSFKNLYKYHDGGKKYTYTVSEEPVPGYILTVDGFNMKNTLKTGTVTLNKTDGNGEPMEGVTFKLYTDKDKPVKSSSNGTKYKFFSLSDNEDDAVYTTNADGQIIIEDLPVGKYYFEESKTAIGFIPYGEKLSFEIDGDTDIDLDASLDVENAKAVMPETGGIGDGIFAFVAIMLIVIGSAILCTYIPTKTKKKG